MSEYEVGTVLEDMDGDYWTVQEGGVLLSLAADYLPSIDHVSRNYGPLTVISDRSTPSPANPPAWPSIALLGRAGSGKDTAASLLAEKYGHVRVAFADALKGMALAVDPMIAADMHYAPIRLSEHVGRVGWDRAKRTPEVRRFLQRLGAEGVRDTIGEDTWINLADRTVQENLAAGRPVALTDVRFPNELEYVRRHGFTLVWIDRLGVAGGEHSSESAVGPEDADEHVVNDGSLADLLGQLSEVVEKGGDTA